ncbi:hypothetical protein IJM16_00410 [Candidatus Saccharibacteria bacterium]|nr:hypothetical protein [Candidatus Saccharibacteria bacterium]
MNNSKRVIKYRILVIGLVLLFLVVESIILNYAKFEYDHEQSRYTAEELSIKLSMISLALQSGDKAAYTQAVSDYRSNLDVFEKNHYIKVKASDLLHRLKDYSGILLEDSEFITKLMELRMAIATISNVSIAAQSEEIDAIKVYDIVQNYTNFRNGLENFEAPELAELVKTLTAMSNDVIQVAEKSAVCISICPDSTLSEKQKAIEDVASRYSDDLAKLSAAASEKYNPNQLILDLNSYSGL